MTKQFESSEMNSLLTMSSTNRRGSALPTILGVATLVFVLDQLTKYLVVQTIPMYQSLSILPILDRLIKFTYIINTGAAFGMFPQFGNIFTVIAIVVIVAIVFFHNQLPIDNLWIRVSLGLQLGGALGNLVDRLVRGFVVDFVDIGFWPIFNLADLSIVGGVAILAYYLWDEDESTGKAHSTSALSEG